MLKKTVSFYFGPMDKKSPEEYNTVTKVLNPQRKSGFPQEGKRGSERFCKRYSPVRDEGFGRRR